MSAAAITSSHVQPAGVNSSSAAASSSSSSSSSSATVVPATSPSTLPQHNFSFEWMDMYIHAQIWFLQSSLFIWVGDNTCAMHSLALAIQSQMDSSPSTSCLLSGGHALGSNPTASANSSSQGPQFGGSFTGEEDQNGTGMASRITSIFKMPVFVSLNMSAQSDPLSSNGGPEQATFIERKLIQELKVCQKLNMFRTQPSNKV